MSYAAAATGCTVSPGASAWWSVGNAAWPGPIRSRLRKASPRLTRSLTRHTEARTGRSPSRGALRWMLVNYRGYPLGRPAPAVVRWVAWPWAARRLRSRRLLGYLPYRGEGRLLDFGCGTGKYIRRIAAAGWQAEGLDASEAMAGLGRESGVLVHTGTLPGAPLPGGSFDAITMWASLEHAPPNGHTQGRSRSPAAGRVADGCRAACR